MKPRNHPKTAVAYCLATLILISALPAYGQRVTPLTTKLDDDNRVFLYGESALQSLQKLDLQTAASINIGARLHDKLFGYFAFNKSEGLNEVNADSFSVNSVIFPETNNGVLYSSISFNPDFFGSSTSTDNPSWDFEFFADGSYNTLKVNKDDVSREFDSRSLQVGARLFWYYCNDSKGKIRLFADVSRFWFNISKRSLGDFKAVFDNTDLPKSYHGIGIQGGLQMDKFTLSFKYKFMGKNNGNDIPLFSGSHYILNLSAAFTIYNF